MNSDQFLGMNAHLNAHLYVKKREIDMFILMRIPILEWIASHVGGCDRIFRKDTIDIPCGFPKFIDCCVTLQSVRSGNLCELQRVVVKDLKSVDYGESIPIRSFMELDNEIAKFRSETLS